MTSSIIASLSILNIWRRGGLTALDDDVVDDDGDNDDDDDDSDDGSDVDLGSVSLLKSKIRSKFRIIRTFRWEKKRCIQKGIIVKCLKGFSWWEKKKRKETEEKITEVFSVIQFCAHSDPPYPFSALALQYWIANYFTCLKRWYLSLNVLIHLKLKINRSPYFYRWA